MSADFLLARKTSAKSPVHPTATRQGNISNMPLLKVAKRGSPYFLDTFIQFDSIVYIALLHIPVSILSRVPNAQSTRVNRDQPFMIQHQATMQFTETRDLTQARLTAFCLVSGGWGQIARHFRFTSKKCALTVSRDLTKTQAA